MLTRFFKRSSTLKFVVSSGLKSTSAGSMNVAKNIALMNALNQRCFSTSMAATKLAKALDKELKYEKENYAELEDAAAFLDESGFEFFEEKSGLTCTLKKEVDGRKVEVVFLARQPSPEPEPDEEDPDQKNKDNQHDPAMDMYDENEITDFSVFVHRDGSDKGLIFDCSTNETEIAISNVMFTSEISKMKKLTRFERSFNYYNGPEFSSLDERLQAALSEFLQGHGINEHLAAFVEIMAVDKDNRLYMQWLEDMKNFVNP